MFVAFITTQKLLKRVSVHYLFVFFLWPKYNIIYIYQNYRTNHALLFLTLEWIHLLSNYKLEYSYYLCPFVGYFIIF